MFRTSISILLGCMCQSPLLPNMVYVLGKNDGVVKECVLGLLGKSDGGWGGLNIVFLEFWTTIFLSFF